MRVGDWLIIAIEKKLAKANGMFFSDSRKREEIISQGKKQCTTIFPLLLGVDDLLRHY
jgi:hypothetical protein